MIPKEKFPTDRNFTVDEIEETGLDRKEVILTLQRMDQDGDGKFVIGRRGGKSRWIWKGKEGVDNTLSFAAELPAPKSFSLKLRDEPISYPAPVIEEKKEEVIVLKPKNGKERDPFLVIRDLREGVLEEKKREEEKNIPVSEIIKTLSAITGFKGVASYEQLKNHLDTVMKELFKLRESAVVEVPPGITPIDRSLLEDPVFWDWDTRKIIAKTLLAYMDCGKKEKPEQVKEVPVIQN